MSLIFGVNEYQGLTNNSPGPSNSLNPASAVSDLLMIVVVAKVVTTSSLKEIKEDKNFIFKFE